MSVYEWQIYCETESAWVTGYGPTAITTCPNNTAHTVTAGSADKKRQYSTAALKLVEFDPEPGQAAVTGYKQVLTVDLRDAQGELTLAGNTTSKMVWMSPPDPIVIHSIKSNITQYQKGDVVNLWVNKDLAIGTTVSTTASGSFSFVSSAFVASILYTGFEVSLYDGGPVELLGRVTAINSATNTITCQYATSRQIAAGSAILLSVHTVNNLKLGNAGPVNFGDDLNSPLGYIAPNTPVTIWYQNNHASPMSWSVDLTIGYGTR